VEKLIACCGLDCGQCPAYIATQKDDQEGLAKTAAQWTEQFKVEVKPEDVICDGCTTPSPKKASYCNMCEIRSCCIGKELENCAICSDYACEKLEKFFKHAPKAREGLEKIRNEE
jgi:thiamine biosynthesis protein ThiC